VTPSLGNWFIMDRETTENKTSWTSLSHEDSSPHHGIWFNVFPFWASFNVLILEVLEVCSCYSFIPRTGFLQNSIICESFIFPYMVCLEKATVICYAIFFIKIMKNQCQGEYTCANPHQVNLMSIF